MISNEKIILELADEVVRLCTDKNVMIATAESCTGGLVAGAVTEIPGSSQVLERGFITYSDQSKIEMLGVMQITLKQYGAVSKDVALEMAHGAMARSEAGISVSTTGIAGPVRRLDRQTRRPRAFRRPPLQGRHDPPRDEFWRDRPPPDPGRRR